MKAVVCKDKQLSVTELPEPVLEEGQTLVKVLRCGICGSDLHVRQHCDHWGALAARSGYRQLTSSSQPVVFGHEFSGEVLINLDPTRVAPNCTNVEKVQQQNLESLLRAIKILDCATNGQLDTAKLEKAHGQVVEIIAKHKGIRQHEGRYYHKVTLLLTGTAPDLTPVTGTLPALPGQAPAAPATQGGADPLGNLW